MKGKQWKLYPRNQTNVSTVRQQHLETAELPDEILVDTDGSRAREKEGVTG